MVRWSEVKHHHMRTSIEVPAGTERWRALASARKSELAHKWSWEWLIDMTELKFICCFYGNAFLWKLKTKYKLLLDCRFDIHVVGRDLFCWKLPEHNIMCTILHHLPPHTATQLYWFRVLHVSWQCLTLTYCLCSFTSLSFLKSIPTRTIQVKLVKPSVWHSSFL